MADIVITETITYDGASIGDAVITISREGQVDPDTSDQIKVKVELELPAESTDSDLVGFTFLHPDLIFESRASTVFTAELTREWSASAAKCARTAEYLGADYATEEAAAQAFGTSELATLTTALATRQTALSAAG